MIKTYYIGGSPCSGKSTVTEILAEKYGLYYFRVDDFLDKYIELGVQKGYPICTRIRLMTADETWMREPLLQCREELTFYEEIFEFVIEVLRLIKGKGIIMAGATYLPKMMKKLNVPKNRYISITPTEEFQISHYKKREWVPYVLEGYSDKEKAFANWMDRDILFAREVENQCFEEQYVSIINDGGLKLDELVGRGAAHLGLGE